MRWCRTPNTATVWQTTFISYVFTAYIWTIRCIILKKSVTCESWLPNSIYSSTGLIFRITLQRRSALWNQGFKQHPVLLYWTCTRWASIKISRCHLITNFQEHWSILCNVCADFPYCILLLWNPSLNTHMLKCSCTITLTQQTRQRRIFPKIQPTSIYRIKNKAKTQRNSGLMTTK